MVLWVNYVPDTWGSSISDVNIMPKEVAADYTRKVYEVFEEFEPIYVVSGDTDFSSEETVAYYKIALDALCDWSPDSLKACHIKRGYDVIPKEFEEKLDFYMYQSGHNSMGQDMAYKLAESFCLRKPEKPVVNSEPCYEQMGYSRNLYGRFGREEVRRAAWQSILAGACAGITYGAHGIWNWYTKGMKKNRILGEGFDTARVWQDALMFPGAWEYGFIREFWEEKKLGRLDAAQELLGNDTREIRVARAENNVYLIYLPVNTKVVLNQELEGYRFRVLDLEEKRVGHPNVKVQDGKTVIDMHRFEKDAVIWAWK